MHLEIISPDKQLFAGEAKSIIVPALDGQLGILDNHAPLIAALASGSVIIKNDKDENTFDINGGVVEVFNNKVIVLAE